MIIKLPTISNLGSITVGDMGNVSKLSQKSLDDRSFLIKLVAYKLEDAGVSEADIENIPNEEFLGILVKWLKDNNLSIDEVNPSFQNIVDTLKGELEVITSEPNLGLSSSQIQELAQNFSTVQFSDKLNFNNLNIPQLTINFPHLYTHSPSLIEIFPPKYFERSLSFLTEQNLEITKGFATLQTENMFATQLLSKRAIDNFIELSRVLSNNIHVPTNRELSKLQKVIDNLIEKYPYSIPKDTKTIEKVSQESRNISNIQEMLSKLDKSFLPLFNGALDALNSDNPDKLRHFFTSVREIYTHIMQIFATDKDVLKWNPNSECDNGRLTRRSRLNYIFYQSGNNSLSFDKEINEILDIIKNTNCYLHKLKINISENELSQFKNRFLISLRTILNVLILNNSII